MIGIGITHGYIVYTEVVKPPVKSGFPHFLWLRKYGKKIPQPTRIVYQPISTKFSLNCPALRPRGPINGEKMCHLYVGICIYSHSYESWKGISESKSLILLNQVEQHDFFYLPAINLSLNIQIQIGIGTNEGDTFLVNFACFDVYKNPPK